MRWTRASARRARSLRTSKSVWSRPPDAEVKSCGFVRRRGLSSPAPRGEHAISRKPSRRECRTVRRTCHDLRVFFSTHCTQGCGCVSAPGIPCALRILGRKMMQNSGRSCRENVGARPIPVIASEAKQSIPQLADTWIASLRAQ
jgi:hypothetical protein